MVGAYNAAVSYTYSIQPSVTSQAPPQGCAATASDSTPTNVPWLLVNGSTATSGCRHHQSESDDIGPTGGPRARNVRRLSEPGSRGVDNTDRNLPGGPEFFGDLQLFLHARRHCACGPDHPEFGERVRRRGGEHLAGYASDQNWLSAVLNGAGSGFTVTMNATPTGLSAGTYYGAVAVTDLSGEVLELLATLTVAGPSKTATTTQLSASPNPANTSQAVTLTATFPVGGSRQRHLL